MSTHIEIAERDHAGVDPALLSHELRNPLAVILGNANYLLRTAPQTAGLEPLIDIQQSAERAVAIIRCFLEPAGGEITEPVSLQAACRRVRDQIHRRSPDRPIELYFEGGPDLARSSQVQVEEVLHNLVNNADKYSPTGLPIVISVNRTEGELRVSVSDYGPGIPPNEQENIFRRRYRMASHRDQAGTGLGLLVCLKLVEEWGGRIWYEVRQDRPRSTFCFTLPLWTVEE